MSTTFVRNDTLARSATLGDALFAPSTLARQCALVLGFSLLIALSAQVVIPLPFTPVPITGQTFAVLLTGALLGWRLGALALVAYLVEGAIGLPFFRGGNAGATYLLMSPTNGYLFAYPIAAFLTGYLSERGWDRNLLTSAAAMLFGSFIILFGGWLGMSRFYTAFEAYKLGVEPFLIGDVIKIALAAAMLPAGWRLIGNRRLSEKS